MKANKFTKIMGWILFIVGGIILSIYMDTFKDVLILSFGVGLTDAGYMIAKHPETIIEEK